ncbi:hypothetical protein PG995_016164 [Apiospora arundinis]
MEALPLAPGPKLAPFKGNPNKLEIDFIKYLGSGVHAHVWKVQIDGDVYALKMFKFGNHFTPASYFRVKLSKEDEVLYMHPFNCEARAYARLKEVNQDHIAIPCHGYVLLDQEQQTVLRMKDTGHDWAEDWCYDEVYAGQPIQALVKELIDFDPPDMNANINLRLLIPAIDSSKTARTLFNNMVTLHRCGVLHRDINASNVVKGRFLDFSTSWTKPHPCLETKQIESAKSPYDQLGISDADSLDDMIEIWNKFHPPKLRMWLRAAANHKYLKRLRSYAAKYEWEPEDLETKQRKRDSRRYYRSRKKQAKQIKTHDESKTY